MAANELWLTTGVAAAHLGETPQTVRMRVQRKQLAGKRVTSEGGRTTILVKESSVRAWLKAHPVHPDPDLGQRLQDVEGVLQTILGDRPLRQVVRAQSRVVEALNEVVRRQGEALRYRALADIESSAAFNALRRVHEEEAALTALAGLPDVIVP